MAVNPASAARLRMQDEGQIRRAPIRGCAAAAEAGPAMGSTALDTATTAGVGTSAITADAAIARVLAAERDARTAVAESAQQAERELQAARERVRAITARGAARVARVQRCIEHRLDEALAAIAAEQAALAQPRAHVALDAQRLAAVVDRLADELTRGAAGRAGDEHR